MYKSNYSELRRPVKECITCKKTKPIKAYGNCQACWHSWKRRNQPEFYLRNKWTEIKQRCINSNKPPAQLKTYYGRKYCTMDEFLEKFLTDETYLTLFHAWKNAGHPFKLSPSIDRIDNDKDYVIDNLQFLTHSQNSSKDQDTTPVIIYDAKTKKIVGKYSSQQLASRTLKIQQANLWKVLNGERNTVSGYFARYA